MTLRPVRLLLASALVWVIAVAITLQTKDKILVPTVILVGSFAMPVAMVALALSRTDAVERLTVDVLVLGFFGAGTLGVLCTALTETYLLPSVAGTFFAVGLIEEVGKGAVLLLVARKVQDRRPLDGIVLGATVGAGFAAFESSGYAFSALADHADDHPVVNVIQTELFRAALAPFGHITWTALVGGALFARHHRVLTLIGVVFLHAFWDASYGTAIRITQGLVGDGWEVNWPSTANWVGEPTGHTLFVFQVVYDALLIIIGTVGALWLRNRWRQARRA